jgi:putative ABC transport system permease protein
MSGVLSAILRLCRIVAGRWAIYLLMISGLALGYATAIAVGLYIRDELTFDSYVPRADKVYLISAKYGPTGRPLIDSDRTPAGIARWIRADLPAADQVARLDTVEWPMRSPRLHMKERFYWADSNIFAVLKLPVLRGDLNTALAMPGSVVLTKRRAMAYFGTDDVLGKVLTTNAGLRLTVTAVLRDIPANTHLDREIFASGTTPQGKLYTYDHTWDYLWPNTYTYVTFKNDKVPRDFASRLAEISRRHWQGPNNLPDGFALIPLNRLHFLAHGDGELKPRGHIDSVFALIGVALATVMLALINFSGLILVERNERTSEMALYSALGARRIDLIGRILRESLIVNATGAWLGLVVTERLLPSLNQALSLNLDLWRLPVGVLVSLIAGAALLAILGAIVPAFIVSRTHPSKISSDNDIRSMPWRGWVMAQLALVIVLLIASHTLQRQWTFATHEALRFNGDNVIMVRLGEDRQINEAFNRGIRSVAGVTAAAESWGAPTNDYVRPAWINIPGHPMIVLTRNSVHPDFFKVYGVRMLAGRNLSAPFLFPEVPKEILINLAAVKALGFSSPQAAIGKEIGYGTDRTFMRSKIVGVIPDLRVTTLYQPMQPMIFDGFSKYNTHVNVRLRPGDEASTLRRIDDLWTQAAAGSVQIERRSFHDYLLQQYHELHQQMIVFKIVSGVAIMLSTMGLIGLSILLTRHQVRELAIRKALGATVSDLVIQRMTPFLVPLLLTNIIAWPIAWIALQAWLASFTEHITLSPVSFLGAGSVAVFASVITLSLYSSITARDFSVPAILRHK